MDRSPTSTEEFDGLIQFGSRVVFDWDNTLKVINHEKGKLESRLPPGFLMHLIKDKQCELFIISAIRPSRMNLDTLLMEADRLGLRELFCPDFQKQNWSVESEDMIAQSVKGHVMSQQQLQLPCTHGTQAKIVHGTFQYVHWGNIIICGYDKAEVFLECVGEKNKSADVVDGPAVAQVFESALAYDLDDADGSGIKNETETAEQKPVVFFDDEEVNIVNFQNIVKNSKCVLVK